VALEDEPDERTPHVGWVPAIPDRATVDQHAALVLCFEAADQREQRALARS
jgi:hypothetical protein